jgi:hypothetical protein
MPYNSAFVESLNKMPISEIVSTNLTKDTTNNKGKRRNQRKSEETEALYLKSLTKLGS